MPAASHKSTGDLTHHQADIVDYISDIASELAQMADRAGCENLGRDLRQALSPRMIQAKSRRVTVFKPALALYLHRRHAFRYDCKIRHHLP